ncbi:hypothetical protein [Cognatishimia activa]|uniref:hypothetical protein n=1 Tax=Cognatishimia activa TaxID=1715691 RepID=UPI0022315F70|nr:hypothetical protein [Cognatishimia activa]UZD91139.1 hypothetical protein M0D42_00565 [Cognatishimia activa]
MTKDNALPKPAKMLERELSQETLMAIKAIVREDRQAKTMPENSLDIPGRQRRRARAEKKAANKKAVNKEHSTLRLRASPLADKPENTSLRNSFLTWVTPRRLAIATIIAAILIEPWFIPTVLLIAVFVTSFIALALGPDRIRHYSELGWKRYSKRNPKKAQRLQKKAMARMERLQKRLDKLPLNIDLPQMQTEKEQSAAETAHSRRMARIAQEERQQSYS